LRCLVLACVGLLCTACGGSLFESDIPVPSRYVIAAAPRAATATQSAASQTDLSIGRPDVAPGLDTERVAVLRGRQLDYFRAAQWGGSVTEIVQALLVSSFQDQQLFRSVTSEQARVSGDYMLDVEVRDFQADYTDGKPAPDVRVTMVGRIIRIADRELVETIFATAQRPAGENRMSTVAAAFEAAAQQVALELAKKAAAAVAKDKEQKGTK
jgi:cholesterol transport system auxiliary component